MRSEIALITILTDDVSRLVRFYESVLGFTINADMDQYVEFAHEGVRFAVCDRAIMQEATGSARFAETPRGQSFELAFPCKSADDVDHSYERIVAAGAEPVKAPANMPWGQRTAFFADPDGNIHELFADLPTEEA